MPVRIRPLRRRSRTRCPSTRASCRSCRPAGRRSSSPPRRRCRRHRDRVPRPPGDRRIRAVHARRRRRPRHARRQPIAHTVTASAAAGDRDTTDNSATGSTIAAPAAPDVTTVAPGSGPPGTAVGIDGTRLGQATAVSFGDVAASFTIDSSGHITAVAPRGCRRDGRRPGRQRDRAQRRLIVGTLHVRRAHRYPLRWPPPHRSPGDGSSAGASPTSAATRCAARAGSSRATAAGYAAVHGSRRGARHRTCGAVGQPGTPLYAGDRLVVALR